MVKQAFPLQPMVYHPGTDLHIAASEDPTPQQLDMARGKMQPLKSPGRNRVLLGTEASGRPRLELFLKSSSLWEGPTLE